MRYRGGDPYEPIDIDRELIRLRLLLEDNDRQIREHREYLRRDREVDLRRDREVAAREARERAATAGASGAEFDVMLELHRTREAHPDWDERTVYDETRRAHRAAFEAYRAEMNGWTTDLAKAKATDDDGRGDVYGDVGENDLVVGTDAVAMFTGRVEKLSRKMVEAGKAKADADAAAMSAVATQNPNLYRAYSKAVSRPVR
jgi:hypothetical protein